MLAQGQSSSSKKKRGRLATNVISEQIILAKKNKKKLINSLVISFILYIILWRIEIFIISIFCLWEYDPYLQFFISSLICFLKFYGSYRSSLIWKLLMDFSLFYFLIGYLRHTENYWYIYFIGNLISDFFINKVFAVDFYYEKL